MNPILAAFLEAAAPEVIGFIKGLFAARHPDQPMPTDAEWQAAWPVLRDATLAKDDAFRAEV